MLNHSVSKGSIIQQDDKSEFLSQMIPFFKMGVEYVGIINKKGKLEDVLFKQIDLGLTEEKKELFFMTLQLHNSMHSDFDDEFGQVKHITIERQKSRFVLIKKDEGILLIKLNKSANPFFVMDKIPGILDSYKQLLKISNGVVHHEHL
jgi:hypothetical protein